MLGNVEKICLWVQLMRCEVYDMNGNFFLQLSGSLQNYWENKYNHEIELENDISGSISSNLSVYTNMIEKYNVLFLYSKIFSLSDFSLASES